MSSKLNSSAQELNHLLGLDDGSVAISFRDQADPGVPRIDASRVSSCSYWKEAAMGRTFFTESSDQLGCPVGAFTQGVELPAAKAEELQQLAGTMIELKYLGAEEVEGMPRRESFRVAQYGPAATAPFEADVLLLSVSPRQGMLLSEAFRRAGVTERPGMGRPTCAALPVVLAEGGAMTSWGCIGNRVYTDLPDGELYAVLAGEVLPRVVEELATICAANAALERFHRERRAAHPA